MSAKVEMLCEWSWYCDDCSEDSDAFDNLDDCEESAAQHDEDKHGGDQ